MASHLYLSQVVMMSLLMILALVTVSVTAARDLQMNGIDDDVDISRVCSLTRSPSYCNGVLNLIPGVADKPLHDVAIKMISQGMAKVDNILDLIHYDLIPRATSAKKTHLEYCRTRYEWAIMSNFMLAIKFLRSKDYIGLNKQATNLAAVGNDCEDSFRSSPSAPSPLTQTNSDFTSLVDILTAASHLLSHP